MREADVRQTATTAAPRARWREEMRRAEEHARGRTTSGSPTTSSRSRARWTREFAEAVEALDARIPFKMQSRCDLMTRDTVAALRRAGCAEVWMGAESGSQKVLDAMEKGTARRADLSRRAQNLRAHGIRACLFLQFGYPGEEWDDIQSTIRMVRETRPDDIGVSVSYPLPGHEVLQAGGGAARREEELGGQRRSGDDVSGRVHAANSIARCATRCTWKWRARRGIEELSALWRHVRSRCEKTCAIAEPAHAAMDLLLTHGYFLRRGSQRACRS